MLRATTRISRLCFSSCSGSRGSNGAPWFSHGIAAKWNTVVAPIRLITRYGSTTGASSPGTRANGGETVDVVDDLSTGSLGNLADARSAGGTLKIHHLDVGTAEASSLIGMREPDVVFHLAAIPRRPAGAMALARAFTTTIALLDAIRTHAIPKVVVALPATALYGSPATRDLPLKEQSLEPRGLRGVIARAARAENSAGPRVMSTSGSRSAKRGSGPTTRG